MGAREKVKGHLNRLTIYQKYLERVVETAEEFHEIREILSRHDTLTSTHGVSTQQIHHNGGFYRVTNVESLSDFQRHEE